MKNRKLTRQVLAGLLGISLLYGGTDFIGMPVEAAKPSLYEQYQAEQKLKDLKRQVAEAQQQIEKEEKASEKQVKKDKKKKTNASADGSSDEVNAEDFATRIQRIIDEHYGETKNNQSAPAESTTDKEPAAEPQPEKNEKVEAKDGNDMAESAIQNKDLQEPPPIKVASQLPPIPTSVNRPSLGEGHYSFDWRGTPLAQSVYSVAKIAGKGVVVNGDIKGSVFMSLKNVTCNQAMDYLANAFNINWMNDGNNIIVSTGDLMKQSRIYQVNYANKENLKEEIKSMGISAENIYANTETGTVSVTATPYQLAEIQKRVKEIDHPVTRCLILAQLIEIDHGKDVNLGMQYSLPTYNHVASTDSTTDTLHGNWLEKLTFSASSAASRSLSKGKVVARPLVLALNGQEGIVDFGDRVPVLTRTDTGSSNTLTVTYENVGTKLKVTPVVNGASGYITLKIDTEVSNITGWVSSGDTRAPQMATRKATTSTYIRSGQSFIIGGLMNARELDNLSGIPGLMNLPILGKLFSYHSRSKSYAEVYVMITPFIVDDEFETQKVYDELKKFDAKNQKDKKNAKLLPDKDWASKLVAPKDSAKE